MGYSVDLPSCRSTCFPFCPTPGNLEPILSYAYLYANLMPTIMLVFINDLALGLIFLYDYFWHNRTLYVIN